MEYPARDRESVVACAKSKQRRHDYKSIELFKQLTKANKDNLTNIKLQSSKNKCLSGCKVYLVFQFGLDVKDDLKYN